MASLSKNGTEIARLTYFEDKTSDVDGSTLNLRFEYSYRSNGVILSKLKIGSHDYGWKVHRKFKPELRRKGGAVLNEAITNHCRSLRNSLFARGIERVEVTGLPAAGA